MHTHLQVLAEETRAQVHERSLQVLAKTGVRVSTAWGRKILGEAGAEVDENTHVVRFPRRLVEQSLASAPKAFTLGARRPDWKLEMNAGACSLVIDGQGVFVYDWQAEERRLAVMDDWLRATRLIDALDDVGVYWDMVEAHDQGDTLADEVTYWGDVFRNFSKHVQEATSGPERGPWFLEVLQVIFGDKKTIRREHPVSFLLCPLSPLAIEGPFTDAYLALLGWDIPVAIMPMPLMGATAPGSLISTVVSGNCEVLSMLCLLQAGAEGTPVIYAPALSVMDPRSGRYAAGSIENGLLGAAAVEMAKFYGLPSMGTYGGTDHYIPCIQSAYERALNGLPPLLAWPDLLVGPGLLGGSMNLSLEQLLIDVEMFRIGRRARQGIVVDEEMWLEDVLDSVGPAGTFLAERSTRRGVRSGEWYIRDLGMHETYEAWEAAGKPTLLQELGERVESILAAREPLPFEPEVERELERIRQRAELEEEKK